MVKNSLGYFPYRIIFAGEGILLANVQLPSRWLKNLLFDIQNLTVPGGKWSDQKINVAYHLTRTLSTISNELTDLDELIVADKEIGSCLEIDWSFEIPKSG
jgi:hypothetical protein